MARDADDVAKVLAYGRRSGIPVTLRAGGTSLNGQAQGDGILVDVRRHWRGIEVVDGGIRARVKPGTVLGHANRGPRSARPEARARPGQHRHRLRRRRGRQQLRRDALRRRRRLLQHGPLAHVRAAVRDDDRHRCAGGRGALRRGRARARRGLAEIRDEIRADEELSRADPAEVRDQEHDRLPALRVPRRGRAARDLPPAAGRLGGDASRSSPRPSSRPSRCRPGRRSPGSTSTGSSRRPSRSRRWSPPARPRSS